MTITTTNTSVQYDGDGGTLPFAVTFQFFEEGTLTVTLRNETTGAETPQVLNSDYTVSGGSGSTGTVTFAVAPTSNDKVIIERSSAFTQATDYVELDDFPAASHEDALDRLTLETQEAKVAAEDAIRAPVTDGTVDMELPNSTLRAGKILGFNVDGTTVAMFDPTTPVAGDVSEDDMTSDGSPTARKMKLRGADIGNVKDFGATGDGVTDDSAAITACIAAHTDVFFPAGTYILGSTVNATGRRLYGETSRGSSTSLKGDSGFTAALLNLVSCTIERIQFQRDTTAAMADHAVKLTGIGCRVLDCIFNSIADPTTPSTAAALYIYSVFTVGTRVEGCNFDLCGIGLVLDTVQATQCSNLYFNRFDHGCIEIVGASLSGVEISSVYVKQNGFSNGDGSQAPIYIEDGDNIHCTNIVLDDVYIDTFTGNSEFGIHVASGASNVTFNETTLINNTAFGVMQAAFLIEGDDVSINGLYVDADTFWLVYFNGATPRTAHVDRLSTGGSVVLRYGNIFDNTSSAGLFYFPSGENAVLSSSFQVNQEYGLVDRTAANGEWMWDLWEQEIAAGGGLNPSVTMRSSTVTVPHAWVTGSGEIEITGLGTQDMARVWRLKHYIADSDTFLGRSITFSIALRASTTITIPGGRIEIGHTGSVAASLDIGILDTNWRDMSVTLDVPTSATDLFVSVSLDHAANDQQISATGTVWIAAPQANLGGDQRQYRALVYERELRGVRRQFETINLGAGERVASNGVAVANNSAEFMLRYETKTTTPTITVSAAGDFDATPGTHTVNAITPSEETDSTALLTVGTSTTAFTAADGVVLVDAGSGNAQVLIDGRT